MVRWRHSTPARAPKATGTWLTALLKDAEIRISMGAWGRRLNTMFMPRRWPSDTRV